MSFLTSLFGDDARILRETDFQLLLLANIPPLIGTAALSPVLDSLIGPFSIAPADVGLMISLFTAPAIAIIPVAGVVADKVGRKPVIVFSLLLFGVAGTAIAFTPDIHVALGLRVLQGIGFAGTMPVTITSIGDIYTGTREATAQGLRISSVGVTQAVFPVIAGLIVTIGWQYPFVLFAIAIPIALAIQRWFTESEPVAHAARDEDVDGGETYRTALLAVIQKPHVFPYLLARGFPVVVWLAFLTYNSLVVTEIHGGSPAQAGILTAVGALASGTAGSQAGRVTGHFSNRLYPLLLSNVSLALGFVVFLYAPAIELAAIGILFTGAGVGFTLSMYRSIITGLAPSSLRGGVVSAAESFGRLMATLTPLVMGGIIAAATPSLGFGPALQLAGMAMALAGGGGGFLCVGFGYLARQSRTS